jgi:uncharacterized protein YggE
MFNHASTFRNLNLLVVSLLALVVSPVSLADEAEPISRILVTGEGRADLAPDMAVLTLTVTREADTARDALDANSNAMTEVLKAMKAAGISGSDLQTSGFSIQPRYFRPPVKPTGEREAPKISGYTVRNSLTVRVRDIAAVGTILDKSVSLGVNEGGNIRFTNDDPSKAISQARTLAVKNAMTKARTLADAAGIKTGRILEISEYASNPRPMNMAQADMAVARSGSAVPVAAGENSYTVTVNVSIEIAQ